MIPAHERLDLGDAPALDLDHRLVVKREVAVADGVAQVQLEPQPIARGFVHALVEELVARLAPRLGVIHGEVGVAQDLLGGGAARDGQGDADAHRDEQLPLLEEEGPLQLGAEPLRHRGHGARVLDVLEQHRELVAAETGDRVLGPEADGQPLAEADEELIARAVTEAVVDHLEAIEVEEEHGEQLAPALGARQGVGEAIYEQCAVGEAGERVAERLPRELVEATGELIDLVGLLLYGGEHLAEALHQRPDLVVPDAARRDVRRLGRGGELGGARDGAGHVPHHEPAPRHQERGEHEQHGDREQIRQVSDGPEQVPPGRLQRVREEEEGDDGGQGQREDGLLLDPLAREGDFPVQLFCAHRASP